jgi:long-chain acyl-CoA synthetase
MEIRNLPQLHRRQAEALGPRVALRHQQFGCYRDLTWHDYREQVEACAAALIDAGILPGERVGLLAENRVEWLITDLAILAAGAVTVPLHAPLTAPQVQFQVADAGAAWLFVSTAAQLAKVRAIRAELPMLRGVIVFDPVDCDDALTWRAFLQRGRALRLHMATEIGDRELQLGQEDLATIIYTSGTTGNPKGVMLTHGNLLSNVEGFHEGSRCGLQSIFLCWLPLSHVYARTVDHYYSIWTGALLCLAESADTLVRNLDEIQPTNMSSVPRFYEKVLTAVADADPKETGRKLRTIFGPRIDWLGSGGAPLPPDIARAYCAAGLLLLQGYGLTESSPVISFNRKDRYKIESVGPPLPNVEVKIAADGELLTRGPHVMKGYWNNPQATAEALAGGWLHTGDLAKLDDEGFLHITGRKKDLIVLSNGKKVAPSLVENKLLADACIDQAVVCGDGKNYLTALLVPHWENLCQQSSGLDMTAANLPEETLAKHPAVVRALAQRVDAALTGLAPWEQVKKFLVLSKPFSVAADELTVSLKLRRNVINAKYHVALEALYHETDVD